MTTTSDLGTFDGLDVSVSRILGNWIFDDFALEHDESLNRKHKLRAGTATIIDKTKVIKVINEQRIKNEQAKGVEQLPLDDDE